MDDIIVPFTVELTDETIACSLEYSHTKGQPLVKSFGYLLQHFFNHPTQHRGQVSTLICQAGVAVAVAVGVGVTDSLI
ncbi:MAG: damage-inducible protein DinB [Oceanospirillaceae bacterium]|nr:damage-inducible protein DinB [Oceanospirillaceae bacterium]